MAGYSPTTLYMPRPGSRQLLKPTPSPQIEPHSLTLFARPGGRLSCPAPPGTTTSDTKEGSFCNKLPSPGFLSSIPTPNPLDWSINYG